MKRRRNNTEDGASWMDTYGDMVTLLLCFFVLLYSISSVDEIKWENLVRSLNPNAKEVSQIVAKGQEEDVTENVPGENHSEIDTKFDEMYDNLVEIKNSAGEALEVEVARGDGYQFIVFKDKVFFGPDDYKLLDEGKYVLDQFSSAIAPASDAIKEIQVLGHTSQADPDIPNEVVSDRVLSATRSAVVVAYMQQKNIIDPKKLVSAAYGQFRPIDTFKTFEGRARNRRVEILITKTGSVEQSLDEYYSQVYKQGD